MIRRILYDLLAVAVKVSGGLHKNSQETENCGHSPTCINILSTLGGNIGFAVGMLHSVFKHGSRSIWQTIQRRQCRLHTRDAKERTLDAHWDYPVYASKRIPGTRWIFLAHVSTLLTPSALPTFILHLKSLQTIKRPKHCMYAYRVVEIRPDLSRILHVGQHDGHEQGSGERLSCILREMQCENVVIVVSRRYPGIKLGSDRWRLFWMTAKDALQRALVAVKEKALETPTSHGSRSSREK